MSKVTSPKKKKSRKWQCPFCHHLADPINVHGHIQCSFCLQNVDPCCSGETTTCLGTVLNVIESNKSS